MDFLKDFPKTILIAIITAFITAVITSATPKIIELYEKKDIEVIITKKYTNEEEIASFRLITSFAKSYGNLKYHENYKIKPILQISDDYNIPKYIKIIEINNKTGRTQGNIKLSFLDSYVYLRDFSGKAEIKINEKTKSEEKMTKKENISGEFIASEIYSGVYIGKDIYIDNMESNGHIIIAIKEIRDTTNVIDNFNMESPPKVINLGVKITQGGKDIEFIGREADDKSLVIDIFGAYDYFIRLVILLTFITLLVVPVAVLMLIYKSIAYIVSNKNRRKRVENTKLEDEIPVENKHPPEVSVSE